MTPLLASFAAAFLAAFVLVPVCRGGARRLGYVAAPRADVGGPKSRNRRTEVVSQDAHQGPRNSRMPTPPAPPRAPASVCRLLAPPAPATPTVIV